MLLPVRNNPHYSYGLADRRTRPAIRPGALRFWNALAWAVLQVCTVEAAYRAPRLLDTRWTWLRAVAKNPHFHWRPHGESNPGLHRERVMS